MELVNAYVDMQPSKPKRPAPRDIHVPEGYERLSNGLIVPERPNPFSPRYEGQSPDETMDEFEKRWKKETRFMYWLFVGVLSAGILTSAISAIMRGLK